jgi:hypothetical protein
MAWHGMAWHGMAMRVDGSRVRLFGFYLIPTL